MWEWRADNPCANRWITLQAVGCKFLFENVKLSFILLVSTEKNETQVRHMRVIPLTECQMSEEKVF